MIPLPCCGRKTAKVRTVCCGRRWIFHDGCWAQILKASTINRYRVRR